MSRFRRKWIAPELRAFLAGRDGAHCYACWGGDLPSLEVDHDVPVSRGGSDEPENLHLLCFVCNQEKSVLTMVEFEKEVYRGVRIPSLRRSAWDVVYALRTLEAEAGA